MKKIYTVETFWDAEAKVWVATGVNVPGLTTEASTMDRLFKKLAVMVPEILRANGMVRAGQKPVIKVLSDFNTKLYA